MRNTLLGVSWRSTFACFVLFVMALNSDSKTVERAQV